MNYQTWYLRQGSIFLFCVVTLFSWFNSFVSRSVIFYIRWWVWYPVAVHPLLWPSLKSLHISSLLLFKVKLMIYYCCYERDVSFLWLRKSVYLRIQLGCHIWWYTMLYGKRLCWCVKYLQDISQISSDTCLLAVSPWCFLLQGWSTYLGCVEEGGPSTVMEMERILSCLPCSTTGTQQLSVILPFMGMSCGSKWYFYRQKERWKKY